MGVSHGQGVTVVVPSRLGNGLLCATRGRGRDGGRTEETVAPFGTAEGLGRRDRCFVSDLLISRVNLPVLPKHR